MITIEVGAKEQELIREINSNPDLLDLTLEYIRNLKKSQQFPPCQYTVDELKERLKKGRASVKEGLYKTQSEMRQKHIIL